MQPVEVNEGERRGEGQHSNPDHKDCSDPHHFPTEACSSPVELAAIVAAWPRLPEAVKAGILALIQASLGAKDKGPGRGKQL
jgi:hypothetical protein